MGDIDYQSSGVDIEEGYRAVRLIKEHAGRTFNASVLNGIGSFASLYELGSYRNPVLVSGSDGVGTKLAIAMNMRRWDTVGIDCVAMCVNDILCHGAKPLFFLDYIACGRLDATVASSIVKGVADGCLEADCALVGGETAEMPGFYQGGEYDIAGFAVGIVEKDSIIDGEGIAAGDVLIGLASSGLHSNGFSLVRKLIRHYDAHFEGRPIGEILLTPTRIYVRQVLALAQKVKIKGMAHITGGGFIENIPRMFKKPLTAVVKLDSWPLPSLFKFISAQGVPRRQMYNTFNMGVGFVLCVAQHEEEAVLRHFSGSGLPAWRIGTVAEGKVECGGEAGEGICLD
jgi:phosphoribosylformylglycinamidine cyclo-ligase